jgi:hypothetical protein
LGYAIAFFDGLRDAGVIDEDHTEWSPEGFIHSTWGVQDSQALF